jgi:hypothetical protein
MRAKEVIAPVPARGCVHTGKTFHRWTLAFIDISARGPFKHLERKCVDCEKRQHVADVPDEETQLLPKTLWCLGDWTWCDGAIEP